MVMLAGQVYSPALHTARLDTRVTRSNRRPIVVRLKIHALMKSRNITAYALSKGTSLTYPSAYRLSRVEGRFGRLHAQTLEELCRFFQVQPGRLLEWVP